MLSSINHKDLLVDDFNNDDTVVRASQLNIQVHKHDKNMGYGANQKTCYQMVLKTDANFIMILHPIYLYTSNETRVDRPEDSAKTIVYLATSPDVESITEKYFYDCRAIRSSGESYDVANAEELWLSSEKRWLGLHRDESRA